ncbi:MAG: hypothetical protein ACT4N8_11480 [Sphingosinicella sp.]|uniref:hypothetical protein n=1 Tax=Sphingosinicella sp. TaxID=1917971 RepID=UPI0040380CB6
MKRLTLLGALCASTLVLAACGGGGTTANKAAPANTAAPAGNTTAGGEGGEGGGEAAGGQAQQNFTINNNTGHVLTTLNVSPSNEDEWGPDILGRDVLANGESAEISFARGETQCQWDIRATYDDGGTTDARGVNLCEVATVDLTAGE